MRTSFAADSPSVMRQLNLTVVLESIRRSGPISRPDLARETGLSRPTITQVVELLLERGYVTETDASGNGLEPKRPGPRAKLLSFRSRLGYLLAIDTGADNTIAKLTDLAGEVLAQERVEHPLLPERDDLLAAIRTTTSSVLSEADVRPEQLHAVVIGTPGVVDPVTGKISLAPQIRNWDGIALAEELGDIADCPIVVENESHLSLLAEGWVGGAQGASNVVYVQLGIGIGGALLIGGEVYRGSTGAAGEIAYLDIGDDDEKLPEGSSSGPFEWFAGGHAYRRHGIEAAKRPEGATLLKLAGGDPEAVTARIVFEAAALDDPTAIAIRDELLDRLGRGIASIVTTMNPELVLIGGGITNAGEAVLAPIRRVVSESSPHPPAIALSTLGSNGTVIGAVRRAMEIADETTFTFLAADAVPDRA